MLIRKAPIMELDYKNYSVRIVHNPNDVILRFTDNTSMRIWEARLTERDFIEVQILGGMEFAVSVLKGVCERADYIAARLIVIEEGQFFPDLYDFVIHAVEKDGKDVIVVGLDGDSDRKPFGQMLELVPMADEILRLTSLCKRCGDGSPALFSALVRGVSKSAQIFVGANDMYEAMCRKHYLENSLLSS